MRQFQGIGDIARREVLAESAKMSLLGDKRKGGSSIHFKGELSFRIVDRALPRGLVRKSCRIRL